MGYFELCFRCEFLQKLFDYKLDHLEKIREDSHRLEQAIVVCIDSVDSDTGEAAQVIANTLS